MGQAAWREPKLAWNCSPHHVRDVRLRPRGVTEDTVDAPAPVHIHGVTNPGKSPRLCHGHEARVICRPSSSIFSTSSLTVTSSLSSDNPALLGVLGLGVGVPNTLLVCGQVAFHRSSHTPEAAPRSCQASLFPSTLEGLLISLMSVRNGFNEIRSLLVGGSKLNEETRNHL